MDQKLCYVDYAPCFLQGPLPLKRGELLVNEHAAQCGVQVPSPCSLSVRAGRLRLPALLTHARMSFSCIAAGGGIAGVIA